MPESPRATLEDNISALASRDAALAEAVHAASPDPRLTRMTARNGALVAGVRLEHGTLPLHSLYDPQGESLKVLESARGAGCYVLFGVGAGFHASALLEDPGVFSIVMIEKDASVLRGLFSCVPLARILADPRVHVVAGLGPIHQVLKSFWQPALMGGLRTVPLRPWCGCEQAFFSGAADEVQSGITSIRADYSVQAHFARRWCANILGNMPIAERVPPRVPRGERAFVTAAGPSLDAQIGFIARERSAALLVATDTSLPALLRSGLTPDAVVSIDCQVHGYHHFLQGIPEQALLFCDLASPGSITRRARNIAFLAGGHPLVSYLCARWMRLPRIDMSGGNVTHAALCLAESLGASRITLCGADFSYPRGGMYARGTYLYDLFMTSQERTTPAESRWYSFLFRSPDTRRELLEGRVLYTTPLLRSYRDRLLQLMERMEAEVIPAPGEGLPLPTRRDHPSRDGASTSLQFEKTACGWRAVLDGYSHALDALSIPRVGPGAWFHSLSAVQAELLSTLLPVAAAVLREKGEGCSPVFAIEEARQWTLLRVRRSLGPHPQ